ncbi:MAG: hypothetical protein NDJ94_21850 [Vicinamibacteria bacterium]|nr:hypothetical protein [Vicinamibacteria bacterium]
MANPRLEDETTSGSIDGERWGLARSGVGLAVLLTALACATLLGATALRSVLRESLQERADTLARSVARAVAFPLAVGVWGRRSSVRDVAPMGPATGSPRRRNPKATSKACTGRPRRSTTNRTCAPSR